MRWLTGLLGKASGFMASPLSGYLFVAAGALFVAVFIAWRMASGSLEDAREEIGAHKANAESYERALKSCGESLQEARHTNERNRQAAENAERRAKLADIALGAMRERMERQENEVQSDAETMRENDKSECRVLSDPLPADFIGWVFDAPEGGD